jgi:hypothetical protein
MSNPIPTYENDSMMSPVRKYCGPFLVAFIVAFAAAISARVIYADNVVRWTSDLENILISAFALGVTTTFLSWWLRLKLVQGVLLVVAALYMAAGSGSSLIGVVSFWFISLAVGAGFSKIVLGGYTVLSASRSGLASVYLVLGYAFVTLTLAILSLTSFNFSAFYLILFGCMSALGIWLTRQDSLSGDIFVRSAVREPFDIPKLIAQSLFCFTLFILCLAALLPETKSDAVAAYRAIIVEMIETGGMVYAPETSAIRLQTLMGLWPQTFGSIMTSDETVAKAINFSTILAAATLLYSWLESRFGALASALAGACLLATPVLFLTSVSAFLDNSLIFMVVGLLFLTSYLARPADLADSPAEALLVPAWRAGIVLGLISIVLVMSKMTALLIAPAIALYVVAALWRTYPLPKLIIIVLVVAVTGLFVFGPFSLFVFGQTGNPVFPYYNEIFQSPYFDDKNFSSQHGGYADTRLFWDMMVNTSEYASSDGKSASSNRDGQLGLISVIMLFGLLSLFLSRGKVSGWASGGLALLCATVGILVVSLLQNNSRYILPILPFIGVSLAAGFFRFSVSGWGRWIALVPGVAMVFGSISLLPQFGYNPTVFGGVWKPNHAEIIHETSSIQEASDHVSAAFGHTGRVVFDHRDGGFEGQSLIAGWYDPATLNVYRQGINRGESKFVLALKELRADAVVLTSRTIERTLAAGNVWIIQALEQKATSVYVIGDTVVYTMPPEVSFNHSRAIKLVAPLNSRQIYRQSGARTAMIQIDYSCEGVGKLIFSGSKSSLLRQTSETASLICDGSQRRVTLRLNELDAGGYVVLRLFSDVFSFTSFRGRIYWRD